MTDNKKYYLHLFSHPQLLAIIIHMSHNDKYLHITFFIIDFIIIMYIAQAYKLVN